MKYAVKDAAKVTSAANAIGLGVQEAALQVYIANRPPLPEYEMLSKLQPMQPGDIARIAAETGNHWRKIFNVYAKLVFALKQAQGRGIKKPPANRRKLIHLIARDMMDRVNV